MFSCDICQKTLTTPFNLKRHKSLCHSTQVTSDLPRVPCPREMVSPVSPLKSEHVPTASNFDMVFKQPFTCLIGPTCSGKSYFLKQLLESDKIQPRPERVIYMYGMWQPLYVEMRKTIPNLHFSEGLPSNCSPDNFPENSLLVFDDLMSDTGKNEQVCELFTKVSFASCKIYFIKGNKVGPFL
jgi:hypothetical protein